MVSWDLVASVSVLRLQLCAHPDLPTSVAAPSLTHCIRSRLLGGCGAHLRSLLICVLGHGRNGVGEEAFSVPPVLFVAAQLIGWWGGHLCPAVSPQMLTFPPST